MPGNGSARHGAAEQHETLDPAAASRDALGAAAPGISALASGLVCKALPDPGVREPRAHSPSQLQPDAELERCSYARPASSGAAGGENPKSNPTNPAAARLPPFPALDVSGSHAPPSPLRLAAAAGASGAVLPAAARIAPPAYQQARGSPYQGTRGGDADMEGSDEEDVDVVGYAHEQAGGTPVRGRLPCPSPTLDPDAANIAASAGAGALAAGAVVAPLSQPRPATAAAEEPDLACHESDPHPNPVDSTSPDASEPNELRAAHALCTLLNVQPEAPPGQALPPGPSTNPAQAGGGTPGGRRSGRNTPVLVSPLAAAAHLRGDSGFQSWRVCWVTCRIGRGRASRCVGWFASCGRPVKSSLMPARQVRGAGGTVSLFFAAVH